MLNNLGSFLHGEVSNLMLTIPECNFHGPDSQASGAGQVNLSRGIFQISHSCGSLILETNVSPAELLSCI